MGNSLNKVILIGNLGKDPEQRNFPNGGSVANFSIATSENWKDKQSGEKKERTEWHKIAIFNEGLVKIVMKYLQKGTKVYIEGQLETRKWQDKEGKDQYTTEIVLRPYVGEIKILSGGIGQGDKRDDRGGGEDHSKGSNGGGRDQRQDQSRHDDDDSIPF